ncbi:MAG: putative 2OG-Fe(II) oxygenase [Sphingomicrobium sp.]
MNTAQPSFPTARALVKYGVDALGSWREEEVLGDFAREAPKFPADAQVWQMWGLLHRAVEDMEAALQCLTRAAALAPNDPKIAHALALTKLDAGLVAIDEFMRARQLAPGDLEVLAGMASALVMAGHPDVAIQGVEQVLADVPSWSRGLAIASHLRWERGDAEGFTRNYAAARLAHPIAEPLWRDELAALLHARQFDKVYCLVAEGRSVLGERAFLTAFEAYALADEGRLVEAEPLFDGLAVSTDSSVQLRRTRFLLQSGRPDEAASLADHWRTSADPDHFWPYLATAWRLTGDPRAEWLEGQEGLVGVYDLTDRIPDLGDLAAQLRTFHHARVQPLTQSLRGGTQTHESLFGRLDPLIQHLRKGIVEAVEEHIAGLPAHDPAHPQLSPQRGPVRFSGSWSVRLSGGGSHANHVHPKGWFSSALYIALPDEIRAEDQAQKGWLTLGEPDADLGLDLKPFRTILPKPGQLVLFPSTLWHGVVPIGAGERLSVAFDIARPPPA